jgi:hypothetical protein
MAVDPDKATVTLPGHDFLYTLDQIALILGVEEKSLKDQKVYFTGRMPDAHHRDRMMAVNIANPESHPDWRVSEREFVRWLGRKGFTVKR